MGPITSILAVSVPVAELTMPAVGTGICKSFQHPFKKDNTTTTKKVDCLILIPQNQPGPFEQHKFHGSLSVIFGNRQLFDLSTTLDSPHSEYKFHSG